MPTGADRATPCSWRPAPSALDATPLAGQADVVTVTFPWGSLLRGVARSDEASLRGIASIARPGGRVEVLASVVPADRRRRHRLPRRVGRVRRSDGRRGAPPASSSSIMRPATSAEVARHGLDLGATARCRRGRSWRLTGVRSASIDRDDRDAPPPRPLILDVDTGIDDSLALLYARRLARGRHRRGDVRVGQRRGPAGRDVNTLAVLELAGRTDIEVAVGREIPLERPLETTPETHGPRGHRLRRAAAAHAAPSATATAST